MYAILKALGIGEGDEVIIPGYTCIVVANPIMYLQAKPVFVDIDPLTYNIDPGKIEAKITSKTKAIVAQHTYGYPCEMDAVMDIAERHGVPIIEDCCHTFLSAYRVQKVGSFGVGSFYSYEWGKPMFRTKPLSGAINL